MAQVKKLQQGGTLNINGKEYTVEQINEYLDSGQFDAQERASLAGTVRAIQEGKARYLDVNSNSLSGDGDVNEDFAEYFGSHGRANRGRSGWSVKKQNRHASRNTDFAIRDRALAKLGDIENYLSSGEVKTKTTDTTKLGKGNGWFYTDGKYIKGPQNTTNEKHIRDVFSYLGSDDEGRKAWELVNWGDDMTALSNWYAGQSADDLLGRIQSNSLTDEDKEVLSYMGYVPTETDVTNSVVASDRDRFAKAGYDYDTWSGIIDFDKDGNAILRTGADGKTAFSSLGGNGNYFFNDSFFANGQNSNLSFLKDHFVIDGKVYKANDASIEGSELYNILRSSGGFYDKNKSGDWEGADQLIKHLWNGTTNYTLGNNTDVYSQFLYDNPNIRWTSITGAYDVPLGEGEQLIEYYDPNDYVDAYGYGTAKWAVLDQDGNFLRYVDSRGNATGNNPSALSGRKIAKTTTGNTDHDGLVIHDFVDETGKSTGIRIYKNPVNGDMIYSGPIKGTINQYQDYKIPKEIADILNVYGDTFWTNLMKNSKRQNDFARMIGRTVSSGIRDFMGKWPFDEIGKKEFMELGISEEHAEELLKWFKYYSKNKNVGKIDQRKVDRLVDKVTLRKNGGVVSKFQPGGAIGTGQTIGHTQHTLQGEYDNPENFAALGSEKLSGADYAEIAALVADATGIGLGLSGAPIASGVAGAIGSLSGFGADIAKDGLDWGDAGSLGVNLALDLASVIPFVGSGAQAGKTVFKLRKIAPTALKLLSAYGISDATKMAFDKITNGDDWTVRDVRTVLNALSGAISLSKTGIGGNKRPTKTTNEVEVKVKGKSEKVRLTDVEVKKINESSNSKQELTDIVATKRGVSASDIDVEGSFVKGRWYKPKTWGTSGKVDAPDTEIPVSWRESIKTDGNPLTRWASGRGYKQAQYNEFLRSGQWKEVTPGTTYRQSKTKPDDSWTDVTEIKDATGNVIGYRGRAPRTTDATNTLRKGFNNSFDFKKLTRRQRELLRRAAIFTPNYVHDRDFKENELPAGYTPIPISVVVQDSLGNRPRFKQGGILKAQSGLKFSDWSEETKQRFRDAKAAAEAAGKTSFDFEGVSYGIKKGADLPEVPNITKQPTNADFNNSANWTTYKDDSATYNGPGSFEYSNTPVVSELSANLTSDIPTLHDITAKYNQSQGITTNHTSPTLLDTYTDYMNDYEANDEKTKQLTGLSLENTLSNDIITAGYDKDVTDKLLKIRAKSAAKAAMDAARQTAGNTPGQNIDGDYNPNLSNIFRGGKLINAFDADKFQRKMARNVYDSTMRGMGSNAQEYYNRFQDFGIIGQYKQYADNLRKPIVNVHSDVNSMYANQIARNDQALKAELEGGLKASQLYSDWLDQINDAKKTYAVRRMETENANRLRASAAENAYWTQMGASRAQRQNVIDNALTEQLGLYNQDRAMNYQLADQNETLQYNTNANNIKSIYQNQLANAITAGTMSKDATLDDYFAANPTKYQEYVKQMTDLQNNTLTRRMDNYKKYNQQSIFSAKKGGSIEKKQRSASDQIWINNQKISADAIKQLSKQAFEFLKMALS